MTIKNNTPQEPFVWIDFESNDFDHFSEIVHSWDTDFLQLDKGPFHSHLQQIILPEIQIGHAKFNCHLDQKGISPKDMWTFVIMAEDASMFKFNHTTTLSTSTLVIYSPGYEINAVSYDGFHIYTFSIHQSHFQELTSTLGLDMIEEKLSKIDRIELMQDQANHLRTQLQDILVDAESLEHKVVSTEGKELLLNFLPIKFLKEIGTQIGCAKEKVIQERDMFFMEARAYIHTHLSESLNIGEIAKKFKLSERSLRNYFKKELNTSPKQYITTLRLRKIRGELEVLYMEKGLVKETAKKFGFHHMGQFSKAYKEFFGELPSETLREV